MSRYQREISVAVAYAILLAVLAVAARRFYRPEELRTILVGSAPVLVAAVGMTLVILSRNIDISHGSQMSVCGVAAGLLAKLGMPMSLVIPATMLVGASMGAINGVFIALFGLPSIVVTLATMVIFREALRWWREGAFVRELPADFQWFGHGQDIGQSEVFLIAILVFLVAVWVLRYFSAGRAIYATGSDPDAAWLVGIRPRRVVFSVFTLMGALTGLAAILSVVRFPNVDPSNGMGLELQVIAAVVVGGVAISGGRGTLIGVLLGVALLATIEPALTFLGASAYWTKALQGGIILIAVASDAFDFKRTKHGLGVTAHN